MQYKSQRIVMYEHLNSAGILFGGRAMSWIDEEAIIFAADLLESINIATLKISEIKFENPAKLGDILLLGTKLSKIGTSTIAIECEIRNKTTNKVIVHVEEVVIVALDENKKPTPHKLAKKNKE
ncbi:MAG: hotdog domain-containing protein [Aliarcobacter sp.]|jgi:acyl-CoA thioesterase YciA|nr:hotdog domain-containing protein [Aliarcobacter sp.]